MINNTVTLLIVIGIILITGCKKDSVSPPPVAEEDYSFPANTKFAVTLYSNQTSYKVGDNFDVKLVFYNLQDVFGAAVELSYDSSFIHITDSSKILIGPYFNTGDSTLTFRKVEQIGRASIGISYVKGSGLVSNGSGTVMKLKCNARKNGSTTFSINGSKLEIRKSDGSFINNFNGLLKENLTINIQ
jgi:hypothetical protein